jgi:hypothetical protein
VPNDSNARTESDLPALLADDGARAIPALECRIGRAQFAIPTDAIERITEYQVRSLPLAKGWVGGFGLHGGVPFLSVALRRRAGAESGDATRGILLKAPTSPIGWALEVDAILAFVSVKLNAKSPDTRGKLPHWTSLSTATSVDARPLWFVDVPAMLADLAGASR